MPSRGTLQGSSRALTNSGDTPQTIMSPEGRGSRQSLPSGSSRSEGSAGPPAAWASWLDDAVASLASRSLLRVLRTLEINPSHRIPPIRAGEGFEPEAQQPQGGPLSLASSGVCPEPANRQTPSKQAEGEGARDEVVREALYREECERSSVDVVVPADVFATWLRESEPPHEASASLPGLSRCALTGPTAEGATSHQDHSQGVPLLLFSGNDYLGLSGHPRVRQAAAEVRTAAVTLSGACLLSQMIRKAFGI